jgi:HEAT repeat protein
MIFELRAIGTVMTNQEKIRAIIHGHATRGDIYNKNEEEEFDKVEIALRGLQKYGNDLIPTLVDALSDPDEAVREVVMRLLWEMDTDDESVLPAMIMALDDSNKSVRHGAAGFVTRFGEKAKAAIPILQSWIDSGDELIRILAAGSILLIDKSQTDAMISLLIDALESDGLEQWEAILQIQSVGELALAAVPALERLVDGDDTTVCWQNPHPFSPIQDQFCLFPNLVLPSIIHSIHPTSVDFPA